MRKLILFVTLMLLCSSVVAQNTTTEDAYIRSLLEQVLGMSVTSALIAQEITDNFNDPEVTGQDMLQWQYNYINYLNAESNRLYDYIQLVSAALGYTFDEIMDVVQEMILKKYSQDKD